MKKYFKFLPIIVLGFALFLNSCSKEDIVLTEKENLSSQKSSSNGILQIISNVNADLEANLIVDESISEENAIILETEEELRNFILNQRELINSSDLPQYETEGCADGIYTGRALTTGFADLNFDVSISDGCISGITGGFSGWTLGIGYSQGETSFGCGSGNVCGTIDYSFFFQGVGTYYQESVCYNISINC